MNEHNIVSHLIHKNGTFPNNETVPLVIYKQPLERTITPELFEKQFTANAWPAAWRNGIYNLHHYHSTAHEVLGVYAGWVEVCFGGPGGTVARAESGDVIIIPAGVSHCNTGQSADFRVVGGYPFGNRADMQFGKPEEHPQVDQNIKAVELPSSDPVFGKNGPLIELWTEVLP